MSINKYFIDNEVYTPDALNKIVGLLRSDGVIGEIPNCLLPTAGTGLKVNIAPGIGVVDGTALELTESLEVDVPASGTYSIAIILDKTNGIANDISIGVLSGTVTGRSVLAVVSASSSAITALTDMRQSSTFAGGLVQPEEVYVAEQAFQRSMGHSATYIGTIGFPPGCTRLKGYIFGNETASFEIDADGNELISGNYFFISSNNRRYEIRRVIQTTGMATGSNFGAGFGLGVCGDYEICIDKAVMANGLLSIHFKASGGSGQLNCKIRLEAR